MDRLEAYLRFVVPYYIAEGKSYLTVAIGCSGGRHRSVVVAAELADRLRTLAGGMGVPPIVNGLPILVFHRDVARADIFGSHPPPRGGLEGEGK